MQRTPTGTGKRPASIDAETVLRHTQTPIDPADLARRLDVPHAALGRVLRRLVESERMRWVWDEAGTRSLCLDARIPCPDGYTEGVQGARLRDRGGPAPERPDGAAAPAPANGPGPTAAGAPPNAAPAPSTPAPSTPAQTPPEATASADDDDAPHDPARILTDVVRKAGRVRRLALARSGAARTGLRRAEAEALIDDLLQHGDLVETRHGSTRWLTVGAPSRDAPAADAPARPHAAGDADAPWMGAVIDAVARLGAARRDQVEALARAPGVGGASANMTAATDTLEAAERIARTPDGRWAVTATATAPRAGATGTTRTVADDRLAAVRDQPDLRTPAHEAILSAERRTSGPVKLRDVADRTGLDVRALLRAAMDLEAVDALEMSRDKRSPAAVTIRAAWRNARLCGPEHAPMAAATALDATAARALLVVNGLGYATAADLDAPSLRRRWDKAGHGAQRALATLRELGLAHGPDRMGRWFPTDAGAGADTEAGRVVGRFRPDALARRV